MKALYIFLSLAALVITGAKGHAMTQLPSGVYPMAGIDENLPYQDLAPLQQMIGPSRVVGLGESIHTSGGYEQAKFRLVKFLVEKMGFRGLLMETPLRDALVTGQYVANCSGGIDKAMNGIFRVFAAKSTEALFQYLCQFNKSHAQDPVKFFGFDIQEPYNNFPLVRNYLEKTAATDATSLLAGVEQCLGAGDDSPDKLYADPVIQAIYKGITPPQDRHDTCLASLMRLNRFLEDHKSELIKRSSESEFFYANLAANSLPAYENQLFYNNGNFQAALESRDGAMAGIVSELLRHEFPNQKVIVWAHNGHLSMAGDKIKYPGQPGYAPHYMGEWLKQFLGNEYFPIGFIGYKVEINWPGMGIQPPPVPTASDSVEFMLHQLNRDYLLVGSPNALVTSKTYYQMEQVQEVPFDQYRAFLYFEKSPGMVYWDH